MKNNKVKIFMVKVGICVWSAFFGVFFSACTLFPSGSFSAESVTVTLDRTEAEMQVGDSLLLTAVASDGDRIEWSSGRENVATVSAGRVVAVSEGTVKITAYCAHAQAICTVTVSAGQNSSSEGENSSAETPPPEEGTERTLVWSDEFSGDSLDLTKWGYQLGTHDVYHGIESSTKDWGNAELQYYTENAVSVSDGMLKITAEKQSYGGKDYTSGRILTRDLATFTYGYIEARMKTPAITGMWPAFWMLPQPSDFTTTDNEYGGWAANGEIDIMEAKGREKNVVGGTLHFGGYWPNNAYKTKSYTMATSTEEWHLYAVDWRADHISWYVDDTEIFRMEASEWYTINSSGESAPFDQPFYLLFDLAVGGTYDGGRAPDESFTSAAMYVDYVRVYE